MLSTGLSLSDLIGASLAFLLTLMTLSYFLGDNPLFRLATHLFIGASAGYAGAVAWSAVIWPRLLAPLLSGQAAGNPVIVAPFLLVLLMLFKVSPRTARLGNASMAFLVGVGAAVAVGGAATGTLLPQMRAALSTGAAPTATLVGEVTPAEALFDGAVALSGAITTLLYFQFGARPDPGNPPARPLLVAPLAFVGQIFIAITFGALYAGALAASIAVLSGRLAFLWDFLSQIMRAVGSAG